MYHYFMGIITSQLFLASFRLLESSLFLSVFHIFSVNSVPSEISAIYVISFGHKF